MFQTRKMPLHTTLIPYRNGLFDSAIAPTLYEIAHATTTSGGPPASCPRGEISLHYDEQELRAPARARRPRVYTVLPFVVAMHTS